MIRRPPRSTRTDTLFPYPTLFRSLVAGTRHELTLGAEVVLHVAGALDRARVDVALELAEDLRVVLADDVGQHVETAAVGHPDGDLVERCLGGRLAELVDDRDRGLGALEAEPLLADELEIGRAHV